MKLNRRAGLQLGGRREFPVQASEELDVSAAASGEAELPQFRGGTVVVVDRLIGGVGVGLPGAVAADLGRDVAKKSGQLRFVVGAHAFACGAPLGFGDHDPDGTGFHRADARPGLTSRYRAMAVISSRHAARLLFQRLSKPSADSALSADGRVAETQQDRTASSVHEAVTSARSITSCAKEGQHGKDAAIVFGCVSQPELVEDPADVGFDGLFAEK